MGLRRLPLRLESAVRRLGGRMGLNAGTWTPANLGTSLLSWHESVNHYVFSDTSYTPAVSSGAILRRIDRRDTTGSQSYARADRNVGTGITWNGSAAAVYNGSSAMTFNSQTSLPGAYTLYAVGTRAGGTAWVPFGRSDSDTNWFQIFSDGNVYAQPGASSAGYTGSTGLILGRWRRNAGGTVFFAGTNMAEVSLGAGVGTVLLDVEGERPGASQFTANANDHRCRIVASADLVTTGDDALMRKYLLSTFGVGL